MSYRDPRAAAFRVGRRCGVPVGLDPGRPGLTEPAFEKAGDFPGQVETEGQPSG